MASPCDLNNYWIIDQAESWGLEKSHKDEVYCGSESISRFITFLLKSRDENENIRINSSLVATIDDNNLSFEHGLYIVSYNVLLTWWSLVIGERLICQVVIWMSHKDSCLFSNITPRAYSPSTDESLMELSGHQTNMICGTLWNHQHVLDRQMVLCEDDHWAYLRVCI